MATSIRKSPPVCLSISIVRLLFRKLTYSKEFITSIVKMKNSDEYKIFRHVEISDKKNIDSSVVFIVRFKFANFSQKINVFISQFPMLLITGFPGFIAKVYAVNEKNGYWQGMYQWESKQAVAEYKKSFVLKMMNKRALQNTVQYFEIEKCSIDNFIKDKLLN